MWEEEKKTEMQLAGDSENMWLGLYILKTVLLVWHEVLSMLIFPSQMVASGNVDPDWKDNKQIIELAIFLLLSSKAITLHISATLECVVASIVMLLVLDPVGKWSNKVYII